MLDYSDLTIVKNSEGKPTALGYTINSLLLQNNKPLFAGGAKHVKGVDHLAVPAGLVCMTETTCTNSYIDANDANDDDYETVPDGLYEKLLALSEKKKLSRSINSKKSKKNKTHKRKQ